MAPNSVVPPFEWAYQHMMLVGWPVIVYYAWKISKWVTETTAVATKLVTQVDTMATNCFPTMQESLKTQDGLMHSMDKSLRTMADVAAASITKRKR